MAAAVAAAEGVAAAVVTEAAGAVALMGAGAAAAGVVRRTQVSQPLDCRFTARAVAAVCLHSQEDMEGGFQEDLSKVGQASSRPGGRNISLPCDVGHCQMMTRAWF